MLIATNRYKVFRSFFMSYTIKEYGRLNNFEANCKADKAGPPTQSQNHNNLILGGAALLLVDALFVIAIYASLTTGVT